MSPRDVSPGILFILQGGDSNVFENRYTEFNGGISVVLVRMLQMVYESRSALCPRKDKLVAAGDLLLLLFQY